MQCCSAITLKRHNCVRDFLAAYAKRAGCDAYVEQRTGAELRREAAQHDVAPTMLDDTPDTVLDDDAFAARPRPFRRPVHTADVQIWTPQGLTITLDVR
eukprot:6381700-Amphidinium_carterae.1